MNTSAKEFARAFYLDWVNNYISLEKIAEHHGISVELARLLISEGRDTHINRIGMANETLVELKK
jgi:hypothetical protein